MFLLALALFTLTSAAAGIAPNAEPLVAARLLQGAAGGMLNPQVIGFIQQLFTGRGAGRAFGLFGAAIGISTAIGPLLGGLLLSGAASRRLALGVLRQRPDRRRGRGPRRPPAPGDAPAATERRQSSTPSACCCSAARSWRS